MDKLADGVQRAAEIVLDLAKFHGDCDHIILATLIEASSAGLRLSNDRAHMKRTDKLVRYGLAKALEACQTFVAIQIEQTMAKSSILKQLAQAVSTKVFLTSLKLMSGPELEDIRLVLCEMSKNDPKARYEDLSEGRVIIYKKLYDYTLDNYLLKPCSEWISALDKLFMQQSGITAISAAQDSFTSKELRMSNDVCHFVLEVDDNDKREILNDKERHGDRILVIVDSQMM